MLPRVYQIERIGSGLLSVMGRPRAGDWANEEFAGLAALGVTDVVSLLEASEARELDLADEAVHCATARLRFHSFPVADRGTPGSAESLSRLACQIYHQCAGGAYTLIHCRAGIGRSGLVAAAVLLHCGFSVDEAFSAISRARGVSVPDTPQQARWLEMHCTAVTTCRLTRKGW
jgi:protein-tyrosine phosphatase